MFLQHGKFLLGHFCRDGVVPSAAVYSAAVPLLVVVVNRRQCYPGVRGFVSRHGHTRRRRGTGCAGGCPLDLLLLLCLLVGAL